MKPAIKITFFSNELLTKKHLQKQPLELFYRKGCSSIFTGKHLCQCHLNKVIGLEACDFIKKRLQHRCFPVNIAKFLRTAILKNINMLLYLPSRDLRPCQTSMMELAGGIHEFRGSFPVFKTKGCY